MESSSRSDSILARLSKPGLLLFIAAVFTSLAYEPKYESPNAPTEALAWDPGARSELVPSLITEDPLEPAYQHFREEFLDDKDALAALEEWREPLSCSSKLCVERLTSAIQQRLKREQEQQKDADQEIELEQVPEKKNAPGRLLVLFESVRGGSYPEDVENRRRGRYASTAALICAGFHPDDSANLSMFWMPASGVHGAGAGPRRIPQADSERGGLVPFEWFNGGEGGHFSDVLVLWLDESAHARGMARFTFQVMQALAEGLGKDRERVDFRFLGPTTSTQLQELAADAARLEHRHTDPKLKILSPYSTAPLEELPGVAELTGAAGPIQVVRTIQTDAVLAQLLVYELSQRIPDLMDLESDAAAPRWIRLLAAPLHGIRFIPPPRPLVQVALITEQDTVYGRAWVGNMETARKAAKLCHLRFRVYPFLRRIDGQGPRADGKNESLEQTKRLGHDYPRDAQQVDYLRRLEGDLADAGELSAIGIFATDKNDTLMILEALRPRFPGVTFFTTDLDARFLHPKHIKSTRNVVVASHYGLSVPAVLREEQGTEALPPLLPPQFREGYQTAVYAALHSLLRNDSNPPVEPPHLYEIGRTRAIELNATLNPDGGAEAARPLASREPATWLERALGRMFGSGAQPAGTVQAGPPAMLLWWGAVSLAALAGLAWSLSRNRWASAERSRKGRFRVPRLVAPVLLAPAVALLLAWALERDPARVYASEPGDVTQGVSAWPAIAVRAVLILFCLGAILRIRRSVADDHHAMAAHWRRTHENELRRLGAPVAWRADCHVMRSQRMGALAAAWARLKRGQSSSTEDGSADPKPRAERKCSGDSGCLLDEWTPADLGITRLPLYALVLFGLLVPFFALSGPMPSPVRGASAYLVDRSVLFGSLIAFFMLSALVVELSYVASRVVTRLVDLEAARAVGAGPAPRERRDRLKLAGRVAASVENLVWYPAIAVCLLILARATVFDAWAWTPVLILVMGFFFLLVLLCVVSMRNAGRMAKAETLRSLRDLREPLKADDAVAKELDALTEEVEKLRGGAFSPLIEHPLVQSLLLPLAALATTMAMERGALAGLLAGF